MLTRTKVLDLMIAALLVLTLAPGPATAAAMKNTIFSHKSSCRTWGNLTPMPPQVLIRVRSFPTYWGKHPARILQSH